MTTKEEKLAKVAYLLTQISDDEFDKVYGPCMEVLTREKEHINLTPVQAETIAMNQPAPVLPGWERLTEKNQTEIIEEVEALVKSRLARQGDPEAVAWREENNAIWEAKTKAAKEAKRVALENITPSWNDFEATQSACFSMLDNRLRGVDRALLRSAMWLNFAVEYYPERLTEEGRANAVKQLNRARRVLKNAQSKKVTA